METDKVKFLINIINDMDIKDKLRLGLLISESNYISLMYDKIKFHNYFDELLKEKDEEYKTAIVNFNKYQIVNFAMSKIVEMNKEEQNKVVLFLFNNIKQL